VQAAFSPSLAAARRTAQQRSSTALCLIACAFLAAAVLRANGMRHEIGGLLTSQAHAAAIPGDEMGDGASDRMLTNEGATPSPPEATDDARLTPDGEGGARQQAERCLDSAFLAAALERERELEEMALEIAGRSRELEVVEKRVASQIAELTRQQEALQAAFGQAEAAAEEEAMQLVSIYEQMKPKQAAQIFDQMPPEVASGFVRRMRKTNSALIMANMDPQKAYAVSLLLAARSGAVRQQ
jgi:flagellar motility protein MotE (MotC chaperone)